MLGRAWPFSAFALSLVLALTAAVAAAAGAGPDHIDRQPVSWHRGRYGRLAVGVPGEDRGTTENTGAVTLLYASSDGLSTAGWEWFTQANGGIPGSPEEGDRFGLALAAGDFNGDSYVDLAVGVPHEDRGVMENAGGVNSLYASLYGMSTVGSQWFDQDSSSIPGSAEEDDYAGAVLATGDFNGDGYADLAIGVPREDLGAWEDTGGVNVLYGSSGGLSANGSQWFDQHDASIPGSAAAGECFGSALAAQDFNGDGYSDLAVGVVRDDVDSGILGGAANVLYGSSDGLSTAGSQWFHQDIPGVLGSAEDFDFFGGALAAGDWNGDGYADLAVGVPREDLVTTRNAGGLNVLYGSSDGLRAAGSQWFDQDTPGMPDHAEESDWFGHALAAGDLNGDGYADLAVGVPLEDVGPWVVENAGAVAVLYGSPHGLSTAGSAWFDQETPGIPDGPGIEDRFGWALAAGDLNGDGYADLAVGVPYEDLGATEDTGGVTVLYGASIEITAVGSQWFTQASSGMPSSPEADDRFGWSLSIWSTPQHIYLPLILRHCGG